MDTDLPLHDPSNDPERPGPDGDENGDDTRDFSTDPGDETAAATTGGGPRSRRKWPRRLALLLGLPILALVLFVLFLTATEPGARFLFNRLGGLMAGTLEAERLEGPLRGPLTLHDLVYETDTLRVHIDRVRLEWRLRELLAKRLDITRLDASGVRVTTLSQEEKEEPGPLPDIHLPINIIVRQAVVEDVTVGSERPDTAEGEEGEPLTIRRIELVTRAIGDRVEIERLDVDSPELALEVDGWLEPQGDYPVNLTVDWAVELPDQPRMAGAGTLTGTLAELRVRQAVREPVTADVDALLGQPLRDLTFDGEVDAEPFDLRTFGADLPEMTLGGRLRLEGAIEAFDAAGNVTVDYPGIGPLAADLELTRTGDRYQFHRAILTTPQGPTRVDAAGEMLIASGSPLSFDLQADYTRLRWPLSGAAAPEEEGGEEEALWSPEGSLTVTGTTESYQLDVDGRFQVAGLPPAPEGPAPLVLSGTGDTSGLDIDSARLRLLGGTVRVRGDVAWSPRVEWDVAVSGAGLDPSRLAEAYPGDLDLEARTAGYLADAGAVGSVAPLRVTGTLKSQPIEASGRVDLAGERIAVRGFEAVWGGAELTADGAVLPELDLTYDLAAPDLQLLLAEASGSAHARGRITGPLETPRIETEADASGFTYGGAAVGHLELTADVDLAPGGRLFLDSHAENVTAAGRKIDVVDLGGEGTRDEHTLELEAEAPEGDVRLAAAGGLDEEMVWRGELTTLDLDLDAGPGRELPAAGRWNLAAPAPVVLSAAEVRLGELCQVSGDARLCSSGEWSPDEGWRADVEIDDFPLQLAGPFLPPDVDVTGTVSGLVTARAAAEGPIVASAELQPGPGTLTYPVPGGGTEELRFGRGRLDAEVGPDVGNGGVVAEMELPLPDLGSVRAELGLPGYRLEGAPGDDQPLTGRLQADITDLSFLQALSEGISDTAGDLTADLRLAGTLGTPRFTGEARLANGRAAVPELGIQLTELNLTAADSPDTPGDSLALTGSVRSGEGRLTLSGTAPTVPTAERPIRVSLRGERFEAMDTREIEMLVSPDLEITYTGQRLAVTGEVRVPEADIEIKKAPQSAVTASDDVVYVGSEGAGGAEDQGLPIAMEIRVILGDDVNVEALGLTAEPEGSILLVDEPGQPTRGIGQIDIAGGTYQAYGQDLKIERGRLVFNGPIGSPRIDLRAYREADDGTVAGLEARGTLEEPEITLWSDPDMSQSDQLSYLLLGRPMNQASNSEGSMVANAAVGLGIKGGNLLAERLAARFGLEEARIETDGGLDEASLTLGKYLTPRFYVAYGVGLFQAVNTLRIRYLLSSKWTLEATTGAEAGADIFYTIERGRGAKREAPSEGATAEDVPEVEGVEDEGGGGP